MADATHTAENMAAIAWGARHQVRAILALVGNRTRKSGSLSKEDIDTISHFASLAEDALTELQERGDWLVQELGRETLEEYCERVKVDGQSRAVSHE